MVNKYFKTGTVRYCLILLMINFGTGFDKVNSAHLSEEAYSPVPFFSQEAPFYFINSIPAAIKLFEKVDLSFFRNQSVVIQYRCRLVIPLGASTVMDGRLFTWSSWTKNNITEVVVPALDLEGGYKLLIEYMTAESGEIRKFEKPFYVYRGSPNIKPEIAGSKTILSPERSAPKTSPITSRTPATSAPVTEKTTAENTTVASKTTTKPVFNAKPANEKIIIEKVPVNYKQIDLKVIDSDITPATFLIAENISAEYSGEPVINKTGTGEDINELITEAIEKKDSALFRKALQNGAGKEIKSADGGNIFHMLSNFLANRELVASIKDMGISINGIDNDGNSPLHIAIMDGEREYSRSLISLGADLNIKNNLQLTPLHLAVYLNDHDAVKDLLFNGANVNLKGNSGYTALHIASEMNYTETAKILLINGAENRVKTNQGLTPKAISKIQHYSEMVELISSKYSDTPMTAIQASIESVNPIKPDKQNIKISFNLPYDKGLAKRRQFNKVIQIISIPVFALSSGGAAYLKSEADHYYRISKTAESETMAKLYFDKSTRYDKNTYIVGGVSLVSLYGFIHSTLSKKSVSRKMYKTFN